jgi:hypothetical protein
MAWLGVDPMKAALRIPLASSRLQSFPPLSRALLQRKCACGGTPGPTGECEACRKKKLQRHSESLHLSSDNHPSSSVSEVPPIVHEVLSSPGQPLGIGTRAFMEPRFGHSFADVRVHTGSKAAASAKAVGAHGYTFGADVVFASGEYESEPTSFAGQLLLAHELTHVIQQGHRQKSAPLKVNSVEDPQEREASDVSVGVLTNSGRGNPALTAASEPGVVQAGWPLIVAGGVGIAGALYALWAYRCLQPLERPMYVATFGSDLARSGGFRLWYYNQTHVPVPSNVWDAFGHCWIACASTQRCGSITAALAGKAREFWREHIDSSPHDSYQQDTANQTSGRGFGSGGADCTTSCQNAALNRTLDLSAPQATHWDPVSGDSP